jgi:hypothetical protein
MQLPRSAMGEFLSRPSVVGRMLKDLAPPNVDPVPVDAFLDLPPALPAPAGPVFNITINVTPSKE